MKIMKIFLHRNRWFWALLVISNMANSGATLAMGTPPQKAEKSLSEATSNAVMLKADDVRAEPDVAASALIRADKGTRVLLLGSQGGWSKIGFAGKTGWVRILSVRADAGANVDLSDLGTLGKKPQGKVVGVAGVRGLDEDMLKLASFNEAEMALLQTFSASRQQAEAFAQAVGLQARTVAYLPASSATKESNK
jgi:hypothetical protein